VNPPILLVDDDGDFMLLVERALKKSRLGASLQYVLDGEEAISYLSRQGKFNDENTFPAPALVLLDLKMPRIGGFEVLQWKSSRPELSKIPFVVFSSSDLERDKKQAAELGARDYLAKPMVFSDLMEIVATLQKFWVD
jgi:CheY-like chemotaxis protein